MHNNHKDKRRSNRGRGGRPAFPEELMDLAARMAARRMPLPLKDDATFKMFLAGPSPESNACLRSILSAMTGRKVTSARVRNSELVPEMAKGKRSRLDVNCEFNDGQKADIELQLTKADDDQKLRALFYACKLYAGSLKSGKEYGAAPSVYQIFLIDFDLFGEDGSPGGRKFYHRAMMRLDDGSVFADRLQILFFDLKVPGDVGEDLKNAANWCKFISGCGKPEVLEELGKDEGWKEDYMTALKTYMRIAAEERAFAWHLSTDRAEADYRNGLKLAEEKGERAKALFSARNMLADGLSHEKIAQYTGLTLEDVEKLAKEPR